MLNNKNMKPKKDNYYYSNFTRLFIESIINPFSEDDILIDNYREVWKDLINLDSKYEVWTVLEGDNNVWYVGKGFHLVNRIGYLITEK